MLQLHPHLAQMITVLLAPAHKTACPSNMGLMTPTWWTLQGRSDCYGGSPAYIKSVFCIQMSAQALQYNAR